MTNDRMTNGAEARVNAIHHLCTQLPPADCRLTHRFTPGMYAREFFMPAGTLVVSARHKTEHPFVVLSGRAAVWTEEGGVTILTAGHVGITKPGTLRVLYIHEDCRWITFHATTETDPAVIEREVVEHHALTPVGECGEYLDEIREMLVAGNREQKGSSRSLLPA